MENLAAASKEELIAIIEALMARVAELEEENRRLRGGKGGRTALSVKPSRPEREQKERKHRDRAFVRRKEQPDEEVAHVVERCPDCGRSLQGGWEHARRQVIEVVLQRRVVDHVIRARRCGVCPPQADCRSWRRGSWGCKASGVSGRVCKVWWRPCISAVGCPCG